MRTYPAGRCGTTMTERCLVSCDCDTYPENLGVCAKWELGSNGRCVYCDHDILCHLQETQ